MTRQSVREYLARQRGGYVAAPRATPASTRACTRTPSKRHPQTPEGSTRRIGGAPVESYVEYEPAPKGSSEQGGPVSNLGRLKVFIQEHGDHETFHIWDAFEDDNRRYQIRLTCCGKVFDRNVLLKTLESREMFVAIRRWMLAHLRPKPLRKSDILWRYMPLSRFNWLLEKRALYCRRLDLQEDQFEGSVPVDYPDHAAHIAYTRYNTYINCWHLSEHENSILWELYQKRFPDDAIVAVRCCSGALEDSCGRQIALSLSRVHYIDFATHKIEKDDWKYFVPAYSKRIQFKHENEVRLSFTETWGLDGDFSKMKKNVPRYYAMQVNVNMLIGEVTVMPGCSDDAFTDAETFMEKAGCPAPVRRSSLDEKPKYGGREG